MSLGSPAVSSSIGIALRIRAPAATPAPFDRKEDSSDEEDGNQSDDEEEMDAMTERAKDAGD